MFIEAILHSCYADQLISSYFCKWQCLWRQTIWRDSIDIWWLECNLKLQQSNGALVEIYNRTGKQR